MRIETPVRADVAESPERPTPGVEVLPLISVLVVITERHDDLHTLYRQVAGELKSRQVPFEFVFVLDGPNFPQAEEQLRELKACHPGVCVYKLNRLFGEAAALRIAAARARGRTLLTLAPYFQLAPGAVGKILDTLDEGFDLVTARREPRVDPWLNRLQSRVFHLLASGLTGVGLRDLSCGLRAISPAVLRAIPLYGDLHRFIPLLAYKEGFRVVEVPFPQSPADARLRVQGPGTYLRRMLDILTVFFLFKFTRKPLRFFGLIGAGLFGIGLLITGYLSVLRLFEATALAGRPLLLLGVLLMTLGVQTGSLGLIGEIIVFTHARRIKEYAVDQHLD